MRNSKYYILSLIILALVVGAQMPDRVILGQAVVIPTVVRNSGTTVRWNAGSVINGGHVVSVTASSASVTVDRTNCAAPTYPACNIVWVNSSGTVSVTSTSAALATASAAGNTILAYVEVSATAITRVTAANQSNNVTKPSVIGYSCGIVVACTAGADGAYMGSATKVVFGSAAMTNGVAAITGLPFTSSNTYGCVASLAATSASVVTGFAGVTGYIQAVPATGATMNITTSPAVGSAPMTYICVGQ